MGHGKIGVSDFALTVSAAIRAQMGIRRISNREIAKLIDRGATYVNSRIKDEKTNGPSATSKNSANSGT